MKYNKPALTVPQQIELLQSRGMQFPDVERARHYLQEINYYRLAGYWLRFEAEHATHRFADGVTFDVVLADYVFDRELKLFVMDAIERIEVALRTRWARELGLRYGAHAHLDHTLFKPRGKTWDHDVSVASLRTEVARSRELFVKNYQKYDESLPPIWVCVEVMSLGQLSRWFASLTQASDRAAIVEGLYLDERLVTSFLHHISVVRNICAHHGRLLGKKLTFPVQLPRKNPDALVATLARCKPDQPYATLSILAWLLTRISPGQQWTQRIADHVDSHAPARQLLGFPDDFRNRPLWT